MDVFESLESEVRSYCRGWPAVFQKASGSHVYDENGRPFLDFFAGAGTLNYGHNNPRLKEKLLMYLAEDNIVHTLDMHSVAKRDFLETFRDGLLAPRGLDYKIQFPGPGGANAVEAALKLARKYTERETIVSFTNAFHGMSLGALAVTGNSMKRSGAGIPLGHSFPIPFDNYLDGRTPDFLLFERFLQDSGSGLDLPAAVIVETVQGEGGLNSATPEWLQNLADLCRRYEILLIVDDVQMGCGRTGPFFSFEEAGIVPDMVCLSKSLSGYGLPFAVTLLKPELDVWEPGEHNGTFRGPAPSFVTAAAAISEYWGGEGLEKQTLAKGEQIQTGLTRVAEAHPEAVVGVRGRGMVQGIVFADPAHASAVCATAFDRGLLMETSGPESEVVKLLPPLTTMTDELAEGLEIIAGSVDTVLA